MEFIINKKEVRPETKGNFIEANTIETTFNEIQDKHIIPVFSKDNNPLISHDVFIETLEQSALEHFKGSVIAKPSIRVSHPIKGRIPEARHKKAIELEDWEKTVYYERMAFMIELPEIYDKVNGNFLNLTIGGVKSYHLDNLNSKKGSAEHFQIFIGFKNNVCTNLCVWTDGLKKDLKVVTVNGLKSEIIELMQSFNSDIMFNKLNQFGEYSLKEREFAQILGRCRLYNHIDKKEKSKLTPFLFTDSQVNQIARQYYIDENFSNSNNEISLWDFYNLLTGSNKSSYINYFLERGENALQFTNALVNHIEGSEFNWFLN